MNDPFAQLGRRRRPWWILFVVGALVVAAVAGLYVRRRSQRPRQQYLTAPVTVGDVLESVEATGTVQPLLQVQVGSQVSGRIIEVYVDFNSRVTRGQPLAQIDPTPFRASVAQARAAVRSAQAQLQRARANESVTSLALARARALRERGLNAPADLDTARGAHEVAAADVAVASAEIARTQAALASVQTSLGYTRILAPIDGVVIQRSIDPGQTVAASFQSPTLFIIANDLTRMQILANIDEADVGKLHADLQADARVDAFPGEVFRGRVTEVRYGSVTTAGVVTYPAEVDVANPDVKLRPGMTATLTVITARHVGVLRVPNAALRFRPGALRPGGGAGGGGMMGGAGRGGAGGPGAAGGPGGAGPRLPTAFRAAGQMGRIFVLRAGRAEPVQVRLGISDGQYTEVSGGDLAPGTPVITDETDEVLPRAGGPGGAGGGGGRGGPGGGRRIF